MKKAELRSKLDEWIIEQKLQEYSQNTLKQYRSNVQRFIDWMPEDEELSKELMIVIPLCKAEKPLIVAYTQRLLVALFCLRLYLLQPEIVDAEPSKKLIYLNDPCVNSCG